MKLWVNSNKNVKFTLLLTLKCQWSLLTWKLGRLIGWLTIVRTPVSGFFNNILIIYVIWMIITAFIGFIVPFFSLLFRGFCYLTSLLPTCRYLPLILRYICLRLVLNWIFLALLTVTCWPNQPNSTTISYWHHISLSPELLP